MPFVYVMQNNNCIQKNLLDQGGIYLNTSPISYINSNPFFINHYNVKNIFADNLVAEPTTFAKEKNIIFF